mmetsp:Transcript_38896/g.64049  ORF Transcript_38896/g.64049 Transcript_38896/m.64049 type:complete len:124 (+) Transcript_38896:229-600(+)
MTFQKRLPAISKTNGMGIFRCSKAASKMANVMIMASFRYFLLAALNLCSTTRVGGHTTNPTQEIFSTLKEMFLLESNVACWEVYPCPTQVQLHRPQYHYEEKKGVLGCSRMFTTQALPQLLLA